MRMRDIADALDYKAEATPNVIEAGAYRDSATLVRDNVSDKPSGRNAQKASCQCRSIRVFPSVLELGPIVCGACGGDFE